MDTLSMDPPVTEVPPADAPPAPPVDPSAPFGRYPNGRRRTKPKGTGRRKAARPAPSTAGTKRSSTKPPDYKPTLLGIGKLVCLPLTFVSPASAYVVDSYLNPPDGSRGLADAINHLAQTRPEWAAMLDRLTTAGPYAELLSIAIPMMVQLAVVNGWLPAALGAQLGAASKDDILAVMRQEAEAREAQAQQERAWHAQNPPPAQAA